MAILYISEYEEMFTERGGHLVQAPKEPTLADQAVDFTSGETKSAAFSSATRYVIITADVDCHVLFGANPTATTSNKKVWKKLYAGFGCDGRSGMKLSVIAAP